MTTGPRVVRPRTDSALWPLTAVGTVIALGVGYVGGLRVFKVAPAGEASEEGEGEGEEIVHTDAGVTDAHPTVVAVKPPVVVDAGVPKVIEPPSVPIQITRAILQSCGSGDELSTMGEHCSVTDGLEELLRKKLQSRLGRCPTAPVAAKTPNGVLSIGLRIDFTHQRVASLAGKSSTLSNSLTFVPCAREALEGDDELWKLTPGHPRYLYFFMVHFGPLPANWDALVAQSHAPTATVTPEIDVGPSHETHDAGVAVVQHPTVSTTPATTPGNAPLGSNPGPADHATSFVSDAGTFPMEELTQDHDVSVVWDRALIRDAPNGPVVVARFIKGAPLWATHRSGNWFYVRWRSGRGWVWKEAIGRE